MIGLAVVVAVAWHEHAEEVKYTAGVLAACAVFVRYMVIPVYRFFKRIESVVQELLPNHGSSLRDAVDRIERRVAALEDFVTNPKEL